MDTQAQTLKQQADQLWEKGDLDGAISNYQQALDLQPDFFQAHANLGSVYAKTEDFDKALKHYEEAIALQPEIAALYSNTAEILNQAASHEHARQFARKALEKQPDFVPALTNLGNALIGLDEKDAALEVLLRAKQLSPDSYEVYSNLGDCFRLRHDFLKAKENFLKAVELNPDVGIIHYKLSTTYGKLGEYDDYIKSLQTALQLDPSLHLGRSNLIFMLNTRGSCSLDELQKELELWDEIHGKEGREHRFTHTPPDTPKQKLKIGYVSPDFRTHSVSFFFESIIQQHDNSRFEIYCYANVAKPDEVTARLQKHADHWRDISTTPDLETAQLIFDDDIDVLIDLAGHTGWSRLKVFTYKPAPVQATYLGGATSTGLRDMDYWITDEVIHPSDTKEPSTEQKYRLPRCFYSYTPLKESPDVLKESRSSVPTFGSFNDFRKLTERTIELWAAALNASPDAVMLLKHKSLSEDFKQAWILDQFKQHDIEPSRIEFAGHTKNHIEHFDLYNNIDVALDPFPFTGATTTIDTLWMGVPTVTLAGDTMASRYSASFLHAVGLGELIAENKEQYAAIANKLINDKARLTELRRSLRQQMQESELCDGKSLTRALEDFYQYAYDRFTSE